MKNYNESSNKELVFRKLYEMLCEFKSVCDKYDLKYSLYAGTLLGAVRDNDFIPWDDDVDIIMLRPDYDKLQELAKQGAFSEPFLLQSPETDPGSPRMFLRLRDSSTTSISKSDVGYKMNHGIFIDIFPADYFPDDPEKRKRLIKKLKLCFKLSSAYCSYYAGLDFKTAALSTKIKYILLYPFYKTGLISSKTMFQRFNKLASSYKPEDCKEISDTLWLIFDDSYHYPKEYFESGYTTHTFRDGEFSIFKKYDEMLTSLYGDYMIPRQDPTAHGDLIQRVDISYTEYIKKYIGAF